MQSSLVAKEVEAAEAEGSSVLILNYRGLKELPAAVLQSRHCQAHLKKLYLKRNFLCFLVSGNRARGYLASSPGGCGLGTRLVVTDHDQPHPPCSLQPPSTAWLQALTDL